MYDIKWIREHPEAFDRGLTRRGLEPLSGKLMALDEKRRYFIVGAFILAAILTPPDVLSQMSLAVPLMLLYEGSIWSVRIVEKKAKAEEAAKDVEKAAAEAATAKPAE